MKNRIQYHIRLLHHATTILFLALTSCEDFLKLDLPKTETVGAGIYSDDATATAAIRGIYHEMIVSGFASGHSSSISFCAGTSSDEFLSQISSLDEFYSNSVAPSNPNIRSIWNTAYKCIYYSNSVIEGLRNSDGVSSLTKMQLEGEAKFIRAFCHFYLFNLFGEVPLITTTDYRINSISYRANSNELYQQIIDDLLEAESLLSKNYSFSNGERVRATAWSAIALLARVYLYMEDWINAEQQSTKVIDNTSLFNLVLDLNSVFLKNSNEAIWQLMPANPTLNTNEAIGFIPVSSTAVPQFVSLTQQLVDAFELGDKRKTNWIKSSIVSAKTYSYPFKYKVRQTGLPITEYSMVLRLAEQYLIRSEARARQGNLVGAMADLDVIRNRAGLPLIFGTNPTIDQSSLLLLIVKERRTELFSEWGHRWLDIKRLNGGNGELGQVKNGLEQTDLLYPIPDLEIANNPNLAPQNPGY